jgi:ankyrin repeat protein
MDETKKQLSEDRVFLNDQNKFSLAVLKGNVEEVKAMLLNKNISPDYHNNAAISYASSRGHLEVVKILLLDPRVDPSDYNNRALKFACDKAHINVIKELLKNARVIATGLYNTYSWIPEVRDLLENSGIKG